jgi:hypothetical protein
MAILKTNTTVGAQTVVVGLDSESFSTSASSNTFSLGTITDEANVFVTLGGIIQVPTLNYTITSNTLQLANTEPLTSGIPLEVRYLLKG